MALAGELLETLKQELRVHRITYAQIAQSLKLSESSIKRLFSEGDMSLSRLESICGLMGLDFAQLAQRAAERRRHLLELSEEQEQRLVANDKQVLMAVHLLYGWTYEQVLQYYAIDPHEGQRLLTVLDSLGMIELLANNQFRITISRDFQWRKDGPIQKFFEREVQGEFFRSKFTGEGELKLVLNGWLSMNTLKAFHENIYRLKKEFEMHKENDRHVPVEERRGTTMVIAVRPWSLEIFEKYAR